MEKYLKRDKEKKRFKAIIFVVIVVLFIFALMTGYTGAWFMTVDNVTIERIVKVQ